MAESRSAFVHKSTSSFAFRSSLPKNKNKILAPRVPTRSTGSIMSRQPPPQPHSGPRYKMVKVVTNAFEITKIPIHEYIQYDISFSPEMGNMKKFLYMAHLQATVVPEIFPQAFLFDGGAVGYAHTSLAQRIGPQRTFHIDLRSDRQYDASKWKPEKSPCVRIDFKMTSGNTIRPQDVIGVIQSLNTRGASAPEYVTNLLQSIFRQATNSKYVNNNKSYFPPVEGRPGDRRPQMGALAVLKNGIQIRRGIFHSVRPTLGRMIITVDTTASAFYPGGLLMEVVSQHLSERDRRDFPRLKEHTQVFRTMVKTFKGLRIKLKYGRNTNKTKTIKDFIERGGRYEFSDDDGNPMTVMDHYQRTYNYILQYPDAPGVVLQLRPTKVIVPMEICILQDDQIFRKTLPEQFTKDMVSFATLRPQERLEIIKTAAAKYPTYETINAAGMHIDTQPITVDGKFFETPTLAYAPRHGREDTVIPKDGKWNILNKQFYAPEQMRCWAILNAAPTEFHGTKQVTDFIMMLGDCCRNLGMNPTEPLALTSFVGGMVSSLENLKNAARAKFQSIYPNVRFDLDDVQRAFLVIIILPAEGGPMRTQAKNWGDIKYGIKTQCVRASKIKMERGLNQYCNNVALKINARLGGLSHKLVNSPTISMLRGDGNGFIIAGADIGHPGPGVFNKPSVASLVFSVDGYGARYAAITRVQPPRVEVIQDMKGMWMSALDTFDAYNEKNPKGIPLIKHLIFFRDGVSEGEFQNVKDKEMEAITDAFKEQKKKVPLMTFIVVGKRHHTLLFPEQGPSEINDGKYNCKAGVAVDTGITSPTLPNFYLQSHAAIQGTSRSAHYTVLHDKIFNFHLSAIEELAFALCHIYAKATRSVSIPAPVYYADLVCQRGNFHVSDTDYTLDDNASAHTSSSDPSFNLENWQKAFKPVHPHLEQTMYFL